MNKIMFIAAALFVVIVYCCNSDDGGDGNGNPSETLNSNDRKTCEKIIDRYAQCTPSMTAADVADQKERCDSPPDPRGLEIRNSWRIEFQTEFDACYLELFDLQSDEAWNPDSPKCANLNDIDDICFPEALLEVRGDALDEQTMRTCIENSAQCEQIVASGHSASGNVAECLNTWAACGDQRGDGDRYWTEDYCLFIVALTDEKKKDARRCLNLPCGRVANCLYETGALNF